ncbi:serine hydrolase domain-containing protein [Streptomyces sp. JJ66]|uniref:serine hydrolase domain-containing protein n=1 Tax=Streptomyces sp. JJ66 TaxID=2803843 RepID=UPI0027E24262|nr:serine hydrolase domain-containing protein [Streptomyces sp. JJ66]
MREAAREVAGPDVVIAFSREGQRLIATGGTAPEPPEGRTHQRYEIGSASKTFTVLLLAALAHTGRVSPHDPVRAHLPPGVRPDAGRAGPRDPLRARRPPHTLPHRSHPGAATLAHLATHTSGLPRLPHDPAYWRQALPAWHTNPYAHYDTGALLAAFARHRPRHRPGTRWRYSNFGGALLGQTLAHTCRTTYADLLTDRVLTPLALCDTGLHPGVPGRDATGHRRDGTPLPPLRMTGFAPAGAVRATPGDLLTYLEAHLTPARTPLGGALHTVRTPVLVRGVRHRQAHTLTWFHDGDGADPVYFHPGATPGQEAFLGFRPATGTAVAALTTRAWTRSSTLGSVARGLLE